MSIKIPSIKIKTKRVRLAYVNFSEFKKDKDGKSLDKYGCMILIPKSDTETVDAIKAGIADIEKQYLELSKKKKVDKNFNFPLLDGDDTEKEGDYYADHYFLNCTTKDAVTVYSREKDENDNLKVVDSKDVYSGMYARVGLSLFFFDNKSTGIAVGLDGVQKIADGVRLAGAAKFDANKEFADDFDDDDSDCDL